MKKIAFLMALALISISSFSQNAGMFLSPIPGGDVVEYIQVKYTQKTDTSLVTDIVFSNGSINEKFPRDYKSVIELYNLLGRVGWSFVSEDKKALKNTNQYTVNFTRKMSMNRGAGNMPQRQMNRRPDGSEQQGQPDVEMERKIEEKKIEKK